MQVAMKSQHKVIGRYQLSEVAREGKFIVYEGHETSNASRHVRVKAILKDQVPLDSVSVRIGIEENVLGRTAAYLRARHRVLQGHDEGGSGLGCSGGGSGGGADLESSTALPSTVSHASASPAVPISDCDVAFELRCAERVLLIHDKMQSSSKIFLIRDLMPSSVHSVLAHGRLPEEGAFFYFYQLIMAVHFLHLHEVVHRSISTEHMYLTKSSMQVRLGGMSACVQERHHRDGGGGGGGHGGASAGANGSGVYDSPQPSLSASQHQSSASPSSVRCSTPQPGSYGICTNCRRDVAIVAQAPDAAFDYSLASTVGHSALSDGGVPPLNRLFTTCRHCGVYQSRLEVMKTAVGTPGYLAPETLAYQPPNSLMSTASQSPTVTTTTTNSTAAAAAASASAPSQSGRFREGQARDVWACGVVLYYMLTASLPFDPLAQGGTVLPPNSTRTPQQVYDMCCRIVAVDFNIPPYLSDASRQLLEWILQRDPQRRPSALDILRHDALAAVRDSVLRM
ncbi:Protein kinase domain containing protein [Novymonas esmeraldas]|uniref:Protein kinase domain containing protein n=1 Tax=Novymonas esmeraldas TaxID=1808958 RepID=A0AAW0F9E1_9TRYP